MPPRSVQQIMPYARGVNLYGASFSNVGGSQIHNDNRYQNNNYGRGGQNNYSGDGQAINHGGDQNLNNGEGSFVTNRSGDNRFKNNNHGPEGQNNYSGDSQAINHGGDQNLNNGGGSFVTNRSGDNRFRNNNHGPGGQNNYSGDGQAINHGGDQNLNNGGGSFVTNRSAPSPPAQSLYNQEFAGTPRGNQGSNDRNNNRRTSSRFNQPGSSRPPTDTEIVERMRGLMRNKNQLRWVLEFRKDKADRMLEDMQRASYSPECEPPLKSSLLDAMTRLCEASGRSVQCQYNASVRKIGYSPFSSKGAFTDVWKGAGVNGNAEVALKVVKSRYINQVSQKIESHTREILKWRTLDHLNIVQFIGSFCFGKNPMEICFVTPWMENGDLVDYLQKNQTDLEKRFSFAWDIASGLEYLHNLNIVHGNLKGHNVLITSDEVACITDYGLVHILDNGSNIRPTPWCAREVLDEGSITQKSDMYAYGTVCCEIFAERVPFHNLSENELYEAIVVRNQCPKLPEIDGPMPWGVVEQCWSTDPSDRPAASEVVKSLEESKWLFSESNTSDDPYSVPPNDPDDPFSFQRH